MEWWKYSALNFFLDILQRHERLNLLIFEFRKKEFGRPPPAHPPTPAPPQDQIQFRMWWKNIKEWTSLKGGRGMKSQALALQTPLLRQKQMYIHTVL